MICTVITYSKVWINRVRLPVLLVSDEHEKWMFPCPRSRLRIWSRETGLAVPSYTQAEYGAHSWDSSRLSRRHHLFIPPYAIGPVPSLSGHEIAYRWCSLPRVCRHRASSPQGSSSNGCCLCRSPGTNERAHLFPRTHYWYVVGMLKVYTNEQLITRVHHAS